jgi:hypothetical protein
VKRLMASCAALAVTGLSLVAAAPASAHPDHWMYTPGAAAKGMYTPSGETVICNLDENRSYAVIHFKNSANGPVHHTAPVYWGCGSERHPLLYEFRVCSSVDSCSVWHRG